MSRKKNSKNAVGPIPILPGKKSTGLVAPGIPEIESGGRNLTAISIHAVNQFYADSKQLTLFSDEKIESYSKETGLQLINKPDSYGMVLNQSQRRVLEGILKAFSDTNYHGVEQVDKYKSLETVYSTGSSKAREKINETYKNAPHIPVIKLTQAELISLSGYDLKLQRQGDKVDVTEAITYLATNQFCFYWVRLKKDDKGKPVRDKNGDYVKEEVMEVGTLFRIRTVREGGELKYYEIHPSSVIIDQVNNKYGGNYFLLVPNNWRDEVKQIVGKNVSSYTYEFLFWLRLQYEQIRRQNNKKTANKPLTLKRSWEDIAIALKMPKTMYKANRKRASKIIQDAYSTAIKLGYLLKVENTGATDVLYLNEAYYPKPGELV